MLLYGSCSVRLQPEVWQCERVGVQALRAAEHGGHGLDGGAHHIVVGVLGGQAPAAGLAMGAQHPALRVLGLEAILHDPTPQQARRAQLGHFQIEVHADRKEERQARRNAVHVQPALRRGAHVLHAVGQREGQFDGLVGARLLHVVAGNRDAVELRHLGGCVRHDVRDHPHRGLGRVDVGVADHELLEDVVLDGAAELSLRDPLFLRGHHIAGQHRQHGAVHGHADRYLVERDAVEQDLHVLDRVDSDSGFADIADHPGVVAVVAPMRRQVEGHAHALAAGGQGLAVEGVAFLGGGEPGVLADGPRTHRVHGGLRAAHEGRKARQGVGVRQPAQVGSGVKRPKLQTLGGGPSQRGRVRRALLGSSTPRFYRIRAGGGEVLGGLGGLAHRFSSRSGMIAPA